MLHRSVFRPEIGVSALGFPPIALLCAGLLLSLALTGCGNYCIAGVFNPGGIVSVGTSPCVINQTMGTVSLRLASSVPPTAGPVTPNFLHIFVTLQGIEANPDTAADENSPDWVELAPELVDQPIQIDLMALGANSCASNLVRQTRVPALVYTQIRLRLVPNRPAGGGDAPQQNACGKVGPHCAVTMNGMIHGLTLETAAPEFHILPDRIADGFFRVLPDAETNLTIEFDTWSSLAVPTGDAVRLVPAFTVAPAAPCNSVPASE
jgi:hypothetical protein